MFSQIDSIEKNAFIIDRIIIAPDPPSIEWGYWGLIPNNPMGFNLNYSKTYRYYLNCGIATNMFDNEFYSFEFSPYQRYKYKLLKLCFKGLIHQHEISYNSKYFVFERFSIFSDFTLNLGAGVSFQNFNNKDFIFLTGIRKYLFFPINKIFHAYLSVDFLYNKNCFEWLSSIYLELYDKDYKKFTFNIGYQTVFEKKDLLLSVNYKYYFYNRKARSY